MSSGELEIVIGSGNEGKITEIRQIMDGLPVTLLTGKDVGGLPEVEETGSTYFENALLKATEIANATGKAVISDDSGIEVDVLDGRPGVRSARFAGPHADDVKNNVRLASLLFGVPAERRTARYRCVALIRFPDGTHLAEEGVCEGVIAMEPKGTGGFGYDPWFIPRGHSKTMAELSPVEKNKISHRGKAFSALRSQLEKRF